MEADQQLCLIVPPSFRKAGSLPCADASRCPGLRKYSAFAIGPTTSITPPQNVSLEERNVTAFEGVDTQRLLLPNRQLSCPLFLVPLTTYIFAIRPRFLSFYLNTNSSP